MSSAYASTMKPRGAPEKVNMAADQRMHTPRLMLRDVPVPEAASVRTVRPARPSLAMSSGNQEVTATASWRPLLYIWPDSGHQVSSVVTDRAAVPDVDPATPVGLVVLTVMAVLAQME